MLNAEAVTQANGAANLGISGRELRGGKQANGITISPVFISRKRRRATKKEQVISESLMQGGGDRQVGKSFLHLVGLMTAKKGEISKRVFFFFFF